MKKDCCTYVGDIIPFLKTVSEENRLKILCFLKPGEKCVCEIEEFLHLPQNLVSHHLKKLKDTGILLSRKSGLKVYYSLNPQIIQQQITSFNSLF